MKKQLDHQKAPCVEPAVYSDGACLATNFGEGWRMAIGRGRFGKNALVLHAHFRRRLPAGGPACIRWT